MIKEELNGLVTCNLAGTLYYYPYKYRVRMGTQNAVPAEYITVLRLGEQYLIRAESRANQNDLPAAISDLNIIRSRARFSRTSINLKSGSGTCINSSGAKKLNYLQSGVTDGWI